MKKLANHLSPLVILALAACGGDAPPADEAAPPPAEAPAAEAPAVDMDLPDGVTPEMVAAGQALFTGAGICFSCHMEGGVGGPTAPDLTDDQWLNIDGSYASIVDNIMTGVAEPREFPAPMPPKGGSAITDEEVQAVAAYVWTLSNGS